MTCAEWPHKIGSFVIFLELTDVRVLIILKSDVWKWGDFLKSYQNTSVVRNKSKPMFNIFIRVRLLEPEYLEEDYPIITFSENKKRKKRTDYIPKFEYYFLRC